MSAVIMQGDSLKLLSSLEPESIQTCVTSPPYWGLRDYKHESQLGAEDSASEYVNNLVSVFRSVHSALKEDGTLWLNLGDSYNGYFANYRATSIDASRQHARQKTESGHGLRSKELKPKDLIGIPWRVALALQEDGWYLRQDIIWHKPNPMPESVKDRCTKAHEYIFLLSKSEKYLYNSDAIAEKSVTGDIRTPYGSKGAWDLDGRPKEKQNGGNPRKAGKNAFRGQGHFRNGAGPANREGRDMSGIGRGLTRNKRSVWTVAVKPFLGAHFATYPPELIEPCIIAGSNEGDTVLDPFCGAGTTGLVAVGRNRKFIGLEINPDSVEIARSRIVSSAPMFNHVEVIV